MITLLLGALLAAIYFFLRATVLKLPRCKSDAKLHGKTAVVTGSSSGIGKATALDLARRGARVILACRDAERGGAALRDIVQATGSQQVVLMDLDLASMASVRTFARRFLRTEPRLDLLVNNAGLLRDGWTDDGFGLMFAVHHLGHFLLTLLLLERLESSGAGRVVTVAACCHGGGELDLRLLEERRDVAAGGGPAALYRKYRLSKLCNVLFTQELSRRLHGRPVTCFCLHPGPSRTQLGRHLGFWLKLLVRPIYFLFSMDPESGAQTTLHCALEQGMEHLSGHFFSRCAPRPDVRAELADEAAALWRLSEDFCGLEAGEGSGSDWQGEVKGHDSKTGSQSGP